MILPDSPYKGLASFGETDADRLFFFGRERESEVVAANLMASRLTVLYGPSGVGKSSLLRAGVAQRLRALVPAGPGDGASPVVAVVDSWRDDPIAAVAAAAGATSGAELADALAELAVVGGAEVYLLLDQMEEYLLYHGRGGGPLAEVLKDVLTRPEVPVHVLLGVRDDALADLDALKRRLPGLFANVLRLDHLTRAAARTAIEGPLRRWEELGGEAMAADEAFVEAVLDEVAAGRIEPQITGRGVVERTAREGRVEAPYLQLVLERMWDVERDRGSSVLRESTLRELGGAERVVQRHLERAVGALDQDDRDLAARLFNHLVTPSGTKIAHAVDDLARYADESPDRLEPVLATLDAARILRRVPGRAGGPPRYEIFHDVLAAAVLAWRSAHDSARALERERLAARRRNRRLGMVAAVALVALAGTAALAAWALSQRADAREHAQTAEAREAAASALSALSEDPERSVRLALRAVELEPSRGMEAVLRRALLESRVRLKATAEEPMEALHLIAGGQIAAVAGRTLTVFEPTLDVRARHMLPGRLLELRRDDALVVSDRSVTVLDPATGAVRRRISVPRGLLPVTDVQTGRPLAPIPAPDSIRHGALNAGGTFVAVSDGTRRTIVLNALTGEARYELDQPSAVTALRFGPAGRTLAVGGSDGSTRLWSVASGTLRNTLRFGHVGHVTDIAFSPRATLLATASTDGTARVWRVGSGESVSVLPGHENYVHDVAFSPDGSFVATAGRDGTARVWRAANGEAIATLRGHGDRVLAAGFLPGGRRVVTAGVDGSVRVWDSVRQPYLRLLARLGQPVERVDVVDGRIEAITSDGRLQRLAFDGSRVGDGAAAPVRPPLRSADGATVRIEGKTAVITRPDGRELVLHGHSDLVTSADFSPDGRLLVTASRDHDPIVWDARRGSEIRRLLGHFAVVSDARFSPDGRWIVTAGPGKPGLWEVASGDLIYLFQGHVDVLLSATFDATSRRIVTGGRDGTVQTYRCTICGHADELTRLARARLAGARAR